MGHENETGRGDPGLHAREALQEEAQVLVAVEVAGVAHERFRGHPRPVRGGVARRGSRRDAGEVARGHAAPAQDLTQLLGDRDAEVGAPRDVRIEQTAQPVSKRPRQAGTEVERQLLGERVVAVVHHRAAGRAADHETRDRRLVVVRVDQVDRLAAHGAPETRHEPEVAHHAPRPRPRPPARRRTVGDQVDGVPAAPDAVGELLYQHLRAAQVRIPTGEDEGEAHHR